MSDLAKLVALCKASVSVEVNPHQDYYQTVEQYINDKRQIPEHYANDIEPDVLAKMIELDTIVALHFYPRNPVGFDAFYHYDVDLAIQRAIEIGECP